jgi:ABC-type dipeptide/oligopeptide/nickel transport system permease subunit
MSPQELWRRFASNRLALGGAVFLVVLLLVAVVAPLLAPFDYAEQIPGSRLGAPSPTHRLGTDDLGRDVFSRLVFGVRISLGVAVAVEVVVVAVGLLVGLAAGFFGGWIDQLLMAWTNVMLSFPDVLLAILLLGTLGARDAGPFQSLQLVVLALGLTGWPPLARLVRGQVLSLRKREFVEAAESLGASPGRILVRHILPNLVSPVIVAVTVDTAGVVLAEATLSFLGIGVQQPIPSWGRMINDALAYYRSSPLLLVFPSACLSLTVLALNFVGDGLRDALDPRSRGRS